MLTIKRNKDTRATKSILHRVADIPGGVSVQAGLLGGSVLLEGTPLGVGSDGLYRVVKTATFRNAAAANATTYEVAKGHHFVVGDFFAAADRDGQTITAIDKRGQDKDVITLAVTLGAALPAGTVAYQATGKNKELAVAPVAIAGTTLDIALAENLYVDAWVIGVVAKANAPDVPDNVKTKLQGIVYL
jgi:hypothetical protein